MKNPNERIISRGSSDFVGVAKIARRRWDRMISLVRKKRSASVRQERNVSQERSPRADRRRESTSTRHSTTLARAKTNAQGRRTSPREADTSKTKSFLDYSHARESTSPSPSPYGVGRRTRVSSTLGREQFAFVRDAVLCNRVTISYSNFQRTPATREKTRERTFVISVKSSNKSRIERMTIV